MAGMTWQQLLVLLSELSPAELSQDVTIQLADEFIPVTQFTRKKLGGGGPAARALDYVQNHGHWFLVPKLESLVGDANAT